MIQVGKSGFNPKKLIQRVKKVIQRVKKAIQRVNHHRKESPKESLKEILEESPMVNPKVLKDLDQKE